MLACQSRQCHVMSCHVMRRCLDAVMPSALLRHAMPCHAVAIKSHMHTYECLVRRRKYGLLTNICLQTLAVYVLPANDQFQGGTVMYGENNFYHRPSSNPLVLYCTAVRRSCLPPLSSAPHRYSIIHLVQFECVNICVFPPQQNLNSVESLFCCAERPRVSQY